METENKVDLRIFFSVGKRDRKRIPITVTITHNTKRQFAELCQIQFGIAQKGFTPYTIVVRHFVGHDNEIKLENSKEVERFNSEPFTVKFHQGIGRFQINHETTRRKLGAEWQIKDARRVQMWLSIALYYGDQLLCESAKQEIIFRNGRTEESETEMTTKVESKRNKEEHEPQENLSSSLPPFPQQQLPDYHPTPPLTSIIAAQEVPNYGNPFMMQMLPFSMPALIPSFTQMRNAVVDVMVNLASKYGIMDTPLEIAVNYFDRYSAHYNHNGVLMVMGIVSLARACAQAQDIYYSSPSREEFARLAGCSQEQFMMFEQQLDQTLGNETRPAIPRHFLNQLLSMIPADPKTTLVANLSMMDNTLIQFPPRVIAVCVLFLAIHTTGIPEELVWLSKQEFEFRPSLEHPCVQSLLSTYYSLSPHQAIYVKFANILEPRLPPFNKT